MRDSLLPQLAQQLDGAGKGSPFGQHLAVELAVADLNRVCFLVGEWSSDLACRGAREETPAHPYPAVDPPTVDRQPNLRERSLPCEHVRVDGVDERAVEVEDQGPLRPVHAGASSSGSPNAV